MTSTVKKICIISDAIQSPFDEGVKVFVFNLIKELSKNYEILALTKSNEKNEKIGRFCKKAIPKNKLFIGKKLRKHLIQFNPDITLYIPIACATLFSFLRMRILKIYQPEAKNVMITLQPRAYLPFTKKVISQINTDLVLAQSDKTVQQLETIGCTVKKIHVGVDLSIFKPIDADTKRKLRAINGIADDRYVVLHVGHINRNRNVQIMKRLQKVEGIQTLVVGSTSTPQDQHLLEELKDGGVLTFERTIKDIEKIYQLSDCYLFPVFLDSACIELPLSVFEAIGCNLPVVSTKYGNLPGLIKENRSFFYADTNKELVDKVNIAREITEPDNLEIAMQFSWKNLAHQIINCCQ